MSESSIYPKTRHPQIVGSFGSPTDLRDWSASSVIKSCDIAEIRLDLLVQNDGTLGSSSWNHLSAVPLLFTARRFDEGGAMAISAAARMELLFKVLDHAAWIDIEVASIDEMSSLLEVLATRNIPWIASSHDFQKLPDSATLVTAAQRAMDAGASVFKAAAKLASLGDLARLAEFQLAHHGLPIATMGMGPLAPVSRLLCAQCGSVFNYGYLGKTATAPGQWDALSLKTSIAKLVPFHI